jgi:hypothetical protein
MRITARTQNAIRTHTKQIKAKQIKANQSKFNQSKAKRSKHKAKHTDTHTKHKASKQTHTQ